MQRVHSEDEVEGGGGDQQGWEKDQQEVRGGQADIHVWVHGDGEGVAKELEGDVGAEGTGVAAAAVVAACEATPTAPPPAGVRVARE